MKLFFTFSCSLFFFMSSPLIADENNIIIGEKYKLFSNILNEERDYWVSLPEEFDRNKKYPVAYLLDGEYHFNYTAGILQNLGGLQGKIPKMILIAIPNTNRLRDLTPTKMTIDHNGKSFDDYKESGGAKNFLAFLTDELAPQIEKQFNTESFRLIIGHSDGGTFALYANLEKPNFFNSLIIMDPSLWWDNEVMIERLEKHTFQTIQKPISIYMSAANNPDSKGYPVGFVINPQRGYFSLLSNQGPNNFKTTFEYFDQENHFSIPLPSLINGLSFIFEGYMFDFEKAFYRPRYLAEHYKEQSRKLGFVIKPDLALFFMLEGILISEKEIDRALETIKIGLEFYPDNKILKEHLTALNN